MNLVARKSDLVACKQQRCRSACLIMQPDQGLFICSRDKT